jgi:hypothetical protein
VVADVINNHRLTGLQRTSRGRSCIDAESRFADHPWSPPVAGLDQQITLLGPVSHDLGVADAGCAGNLRHGPLEQWPDLKVFKRDPTEVTQDALVEAQAPCIVPRIRTGWIISPACSWHASSTDLPARRSRSMERSTASHCRALDQIGRQR